MHYINICYTVTVCYPFLENMNTKLIFSDFFPYLLQTSAYVIFVACLLHCTTHSKALSFHESIHIQTTGKFPFHAAIHATQTISLKNYPKKKKKVCYNIFLSSLLAGIFTSFTFTSVV